MKSLEQAPDEARAVAMLRALANPARYRILRVLAQIDRCVCGGIVDVLPLAQSTVSEHLKVLKEAGLVQGIIDGPNTCYCLEPEAFEWLAGQLRSLPRRPSSGESELITLRPAMNGRSQPHMEAER